MLEKLGSVEQRFETVNELLCKPDVVADMEQYKHLMQELKHLTPIVEKYREYKKCKDSFDEAKELLKAPNSYC